MSTAVLAVAAAGLACLGAIHANDARRERSHRGGALAGLRGVLDAERLAHTPDGFPVLTGRHRGHPAEFRLLADTIQVRKLPVLWLLMTLRRPLPLPGTLDLVLRATSSDFYSPHHDLPETLQPSAGWHEHLTVRSDNAAGTRAWLDRLEPAMDRLRSDDRVKEILLTPKGVRLVWRACESERGHYLLTRQPRFHFGALTTHAGRYLLGWADDLSDALSRPG